MAYYLFLLALSTAERKLHENFTHRRAFQRRKSGHVVRSCGRVLEISFLTFLYLHLFSSTRSHLPTSLERPFDLNQCPTFDFNPQTAQLELIQTLRFLWQCVGHCQSLAAIVQAGQVSRTRRERR
ncbi:hypothetical protein Droror1_Dr00027045 [Drosera rotundifolia]